MKKFIVLLVVLLLVGCAVIEPLPTETPKPTTTKNPYYRVNKSTGLYDAPSVDAAMIGELNVGMFLKPVGDELECVTFSDSGMTFRMCNMSTMGGKTGWVLMKWLDAPD